MTDAITRLPSAPIRAGPAANRNPAKGTNIQTTPCPSRVPRAGRMVRPLVVAANSFKTGFDFSAFSTHERRTAAGQLRTPAL